MSEQNPPARTSRQLRDDADAILNGAGQHAGPEFRDGLDLARALTALADLTSRLDAAESADSSQPPYREISKKYEATLRQIAGYAGHSLTYLRSLARVALDGGES